VQQQRQQLNDGSTKLQDMRHEKNTIQLKLDTAKDSLVKAEEKISSLYTKHSSCGPAAADLNRQLQEATMQVKKIDDELLLEIRAHCASRDMVGLLRIEVKQLKASLDTATTEVRKQKDLLVLENTLDGKGNIALDLATKDDEIRILRCLVEKLVGILMSHRQAFEEKTRRLNELVFTSRLQNAALLSSVEHQHNIQPS
jgi:transcriptional regulator with AAA-type ATPase domain